MEAFKKWQKKRATKTIGYLNALAAYEAGEEEGWRAALGWVLSMEGEEPPLWILELVEQELEEK